MRAAYDDEGGPQPKHPSTPPSNKQHYTAWCLSMPVSHPAQAPAIAGHSWTLLHACYFRHVAPPRKGGAHARCGAGTRQVRGGDARKVSENPLLLTCRGLTIIVCTWCATWRCTVNRCSYPWREAHCCKAYTTEFIKQVVINITRFTV